MCIINPIKVEIIKVFVLNVILSKSDPTGVAEFQLKDLTKEGELVSSFEIHPKSYKIFCFFYNQVWRKSDSW